MSDFAIPSLVGDLLWDLLIAIFVSVRDQEIYNKKVRDQEIATKRLASFYDQKIARIDVTPPDLRETPREASMAEIHAGAGRP